MTILNNDLNTLIIHHFESVWNDGLAKFDMNMEKMSDQIIDFLSEKRPDINNIIITRLEGINYEHEHSKILEFAKENDINIRIEEYGYSYYPENFTKETLKTLDTVKPTRYNSDENNILPIMDWQKELKHHKSVAISGAFDGECVRDMEDIVLHTRGNYERVDELIVGSNVDYQFIMPPSKISNKISKAIESAEAKYGRLSSKGNFDSGLSNIENELNNALLTNKAQRAIKYYSNIAEDMYSNVNEISDIISNIIMTNQPSIQYQETMSNEDKKSLFSKVRNSDSYENDGFPKTKNKNKFSI